MDHDEARRLGEYLERPDVLSQIVGDLSAFAVGVEAVTGGLAIVLRVPDAGVVVAPSEVVVDGEAVRVLVRGGYRPPTPH